MVCASLTIVIRKPLQSKSTANTKTKGQMLIWLLCALKGDSNPGPQICRRVCYHYATGKRGRGGGGLTKESYIGIAKVLGVQN